MRAREDEFFQNVNFFFFPNYWRISKDTSVDQKYIFSDQTLKPVSSNVQVEHFTMMYFILHQ